MGRRRWQLLDLEDESLLFRLASQEGDVGDAAIEAITHLPLRADTWTATQQLLTEKLATVDAERREFLLRVGSWMPTSVDDGIGSFPEIEARDVRPDSGTSGYWWHYPDSVTYLDVDAWARSPAPGSLLIDAAAREEVITRISPRIEQLAEEIELNGPAYSGNATDFKLSPLEATALFDRAVDEWWRLGNNLVAIIGADPAFTPDLLGLFGTYRGVLARYAGGERKEGRRMGAWIMQDRYDDHPDSYLMWQIGWVASRSGIADVVSGLREHLTSDDPHEVIGGLAFLADAADYTVQREPPMFGGGSGPERFGPRSRHRVLDDGDPESTTVRLSASAPLAVQAGSEFTARFVAYAPELEDEIADVLTQLSGRSVHRLNVKECLWRVGARFELELRCRHADVEAQRIELVWDGRRCLADFDVFVPQEAPNHLVLKFDVWMASTRIAGLRIDVEVSGSPGRGRGVAKGRPVTRAFASYSSDDRARVADRVSSLVSVAGIDVFMDVESLRLGGRWDEELLEAIVDRDVLLLFWSKYAAESDWVDWEWRTALALKGLDGILPQPLESVADAPPPDELAELHFGDVYLRHVQAERP